MVAEVVSRIIGGALLATGGWRLGEYISAVWVPQMYMPLVFGLTLTGVVVGLFATPYVTERMADRLSRQIEGIPNSQLLSGVLGMILGLLVGLLISIPMSALPGWFGIGLPIATSVFLAYLGAAVMSSPQRDLFRGIASDEDGGLSGKGRETYSDKILLDTSAIIDGRISEIGHAGFLRGTLIVPRFILDELRHIADSSDPMRRTRGRRGLEILSKLRDEPQVRVQVIDSAYRNGHEVDSMLLEMARSLKASILTTDYNLNRVAQIQSIPVLNVNELANAVKPVVLPGEGMNIRVVQEGKEPGQGVGFLDDGTMVVVEGGHSFLNNDLNVMVTRVLQTAAGCIIFAQPKRS